MKPVSPHTTYTLSTKQLAEEFLNRNLNRNMYTMTVQEKPRFYNKTLLSPQVLKTSNIKVLATEPQVILVMCQEHWKRKANRNLDAL